MTDPQPHPHSHRRSRSGCGGCLLSFHMVALTIVIINWAWRLVWPLLLVALAIGITYAAWQFGRGFISAFTRRTES